MSRAETGLYKDSSRVVPVLLSGRGRPGLLFTAVIVVTTVPQGITVRSISTFFLAAGVGGCQDLTSLGSRKVNFKTKFNFIVFVNKNHSILSKLWTLKISTMLHIIRLIVLPL